MNNEIKDNPVSNLINARNELRDSKLADVFCGLGWAHILPLLIIDGRLRQFIIHSEIDTSSTSDHLNLTISYGYQLDRYLMADILADRLSSHLKRRITVSLVN